MTAMRMMITRTAGTITATAMIALETSFGPSPTNSTKQQKSDYNMIFIMQNIYYQHKSIAQCYAIHVQYTGDIIL